MADYAASVRVLIADHEPEVRQALRLLCEQGFNLTVAADVSDGAELLASVGTAQATILLMEWDLPGIDSPALIKHLHLDQTLKIIVLGNGPEMRSQALNAGAWGFAYKGAPPDELIALLQSLLKEM